MLIGSDKKRAIVGLGISGLSVARFLQKQGALFDVFDTRTNPANAESFKEEFPEVRLLLGAMADDALLGYSEVVLSPGVSLKEPFIQAALNNNIHVTGDVEMFLQAAEAPVVGITGSNGKTTVTTMVGLCAEAAELSVGVGGNIGTPALDLLNDDVDLYVLELSSFQLETIGKPSLTVGCVLNVSPDHMDRYDSFAHYVAAKQRVFYGAKNVVYNIQDLLTQPPAINGVERSGFSTGTPKEEHEIQYLFRRDAGDVCVNSKALLLADEIAIKGLHNIENALAVLAICDAVKIPRDATLSVLKTFSGLEHRCEFVESKSDVYFVNDSKATNVGASIAAINSFNQLGRRVTLIAGGDGKGVDFKEFGECISTNVETVIFIGRDAGEIEKHVVGGTKKMYADSMADAVAKAIEGCSAPGVVLLSPACASFDMYSGYEERGRDFKRNVIEVLAR